MPINKCNIPVPVPSHGTLGLAGEARRGWCRLRLLPSLSAPALCFCPSPSLGASGSSPEWVLPTLPVLACTLPVPCLRAAYPLLAHCLSPACPLPALPVPCLSPACAACPLALPVPCLSPACAACPLALPVPCLSSACPSARPWPRLPHRPRPFDAQRRVHSPAPRERALLSGDTVALGCGRGSGNGGVGMGLGGSSWASWPLLSPPRAASPGAGPCAREAAGDSEEQMLRLEKIRERRAGRGAFRGSLCCSCAVFVSGFSSGQRLVDTMMDGFPAGCLRTPAGRLAAPAFRMPVPGCICGSGFGGLPASPAASGAALRNSVHVPFPDPFLERINECRGREGGQPGARGMPGSLARPPWAALGARVWRLCSPHGPLPGCVCGAGAGADCVHGAVPVGTPGWAAPCSPAGAGWAAGSAGSPGPPCAGQLAGPLPW